MSRIGILSCLASVALFLAPATAQAAGWLAAQDVVASAEIPASEPAVAMAPDGDILVAWTGTGEGGNQALLYRAREAFTGFQDIGLGSGRRPALATDSSGRIWIAFPDEGNDVVVIARSAPNDADNFTGGGDTFNLPGTVTGVPDLAVRPDEGAVVYLEGGQVKLGRWSPADGAVPTTIYDGSSGPAKSARVSLDSAGNLATVFNYPVLGNDCPVKARRITAGSLSAIEDVGSTGSDDAGCGNRTDVDLALGPGGRAMATWWHLDSSPPSVEMSLAAPGSPFGAPAPIATSTFDAVTNPEPLASGAFDVHPRGLLGASDATLHAYLTQPPSATIRRVSQRFDPPAGPPAIQAFETGLGTADLARNASDQAVGSWLNNVSPCHVSAARGTVAGGLGPRQTIGACGGGTTSDPQVAIDGSGNAAAVWTADGAVKLAIYDTTPPELQAVSVPAGATAGQPVTMSASSRDALSATTIRWDFGDGTGANGAGTSHSYAAPGRYTVTSRATDGGGNSASATRIVSVGAARSTDLRSPIVGSLRMASTFRRGSLRPRLTGGRRGPPTGTVIRFRVDEPSVTTLSFRRRLRGRRVGRRCRAATRGRRHRPRCTRFRAVRRKLTFNTQPGLRKIRFQGRLTRRFRLAPGRYELTVRAVDTAGNRSRPVRKRFRLLAELRRPERR